MTHTFIELHFKTIINDGVRELKGDPDMVKYGQIQDYLQACAHNRLAGDGAIHSTMYRVKDGVDTTALSDMMAVHTDHTDWGLDDAVFRGLYLKPGTPSDADVDSLAIRISDHPDLSVDITTVNSNIQEFSDHPDSSASPNQSASHFLKNNTPTFSKTDVDNYKHPFDITNWL